MNKILKNKTFAYGTLIVAIAIVLGCLYTAIHKTGHAAIVAEGNRQKEEVIIFPHAGKKSLIGNEYKWDIADSTEIFRENTPFHFGNIMDVIYDPEWDAHFVEYEIADQMDVEGPAWAEIYINPLLWDSFIKVYTGEIDEDKYDEYLFRIETTYHNGYTFFELLPY